MPAPKTDGRETRAVTIPLEVRTAAQDDEGRTAAGYAALFNVETDIGGYWIEEVAPGAFAKSLNERDCLAVHSHDTGRVVGRLKAGTLSLREDEKGLAFENKLPDTSDGRDLIVQLERGDIAGMSFAFRSVKSEWDETRDPPKRTIVEAELYEITYTAMPAYDATEVGLRSLEASRQERREQNKTAACSRIAARRARQAQAERGIRPD
jgi:HK97 family phage prohead protease